MNLPFPFDPLVIFGALLAIVWVVLAVVGIFRRPDCNGSTDHEG